MMTCKPDYLFGNEDDLQTRIANINASNKISRVTSKKKSNYSNQSGNKRPIYSNRDENQTGKSSFSQHFLGRGRQPPFRKKHWQGAVHTQNKSRVTGNTQSQQWKPVQKY